MHSDDRDELVEEQLRHLLEVLRGGRGAGGAARGGGGGRGQEGILGHATRSRGAPPSKNALRLSIARMPMATRVSWVALPRCGSRTTCSMVRRSGVTWGSFSYTSSAAPAICLPLSAVTSAASSTMRSEEHTSELQSLAYLVCRLLLEKKKLSSIDSAPCIIPRNIH